MQPFLHQLKTIQKNDDIDLQIDKKRLYEKLEKTSIIGLFTLIVKYLKLNIPFMLLVSQLMTNYCLNFELTAMMIIFKKIKS